MRKFWSWLGLNAGKHAGIVALIGLALSVGLGIGVGQLQFKTDNASYLNKTDAAYQDNARYQATFSGDDMVVMFTMKPGHTVEDLLTPANLAELSRVTHRLDAVRDVNTTISPVGILQLIQSLLVSPTGNVTSSPAGQLQLAALSAPQSAHSKALRTAYVGETLTRYDAVSGPHQIGNPSWDRFLLYDNDGKIRRGVNQYFRDSTHALMYVRLAGNLSIEQESQTASTIFHVMSGAHFQNATTTTTGTPAFLKALNDYLKGGLVKLTGLAVLLMLAILILLFNVRWRLLPLGIVAFGLLWAFGLIGWLGVPLTIGTIAALPTMLGVGIDYAIQMHSRVEEEVVLDRVAHPIQATARNLCPALLVVTLDAVFAFCALQFSAVPLIRQFGLILAIGVAVICLGSILGPLSVLGVREYRSPTSAKPNHRDFSKGVLSRVAVRLGSLPRAAAIPLALLSLAIFLGGLAVEGKLVIQTNAVQWVNPQSQTIQNIDTLQRQVQTAGELDVLASGPNLVTDHGLQYLANFQNRVTAEHSSVLQPATSIVGILQDFTHVPGATPAAPTVAGMHTIYTHLPSALQRLLVDPSYGSDRRPALNVIFISKTANLNELQGAVNTINAEHPPAGISVKPGGIAAVGAGLIQDIERHRDLITYLAILFVLAWLTIRLRSIVRALLSVIPVLIAVGLANLVAYALNVQLSPATAVSGPIIVAVCTEFTSLLLLRYIEERSRGLDPRAAFDSTSARTGRAFIVSGLTAIAGIAVVAFSSMPILSGFGEVVAFNVFIALISALVILPPVVVWADQRNWVSHGMLRPDPDALPLVTADGDRGRADAPAPARAPTGSPSPSLRHSALPPGS